MRNNNCSTIAVARRRRNGKNYKSATVAIVTVASSSRGPIPSHLLTNSHKRAVITIKSSFYSRKETKKSIDIAGNEGKNLCALVIAPVKKKKDEDGMEWKKLLQPPSGRRRDAQQTTRRVESGDKRMNFTLSHQLRVVAAVCV